MVVRKMDDQTIFEVARKIGSREARQAYLLQVCGEDLAVSQRIEALLHAHDESESFLELPPPGLSNLPTISQPPVKLLGTQIGPYKLLQQIGEGGMGTVFMAEQTKPVQRKVALKVIKPGMDKLTADFPAVTLYQDELIFSHCDLGDLLESVGRHSEARTAYTRAVGLSPTAQAACFKRAAAFGALGQWEQAAADMSKVVELDPKSAVGHNNLAWLLATCAEARLRDPARAVELAKKALELAPNSVGHSNTLGVAQYRAGDWPATIEALTKSMEERNGGDAFDWYFLAMAHWQSDHKEDARKWFDQAVPWMEKNQPQNEELLRFHAEAAELLGVKDKDK